MRASTCEVWINGKKEDRCISFNVNAHRDMSTFIGQRFAPAAPSGDVKMPQTAELTLELWLMDTRRYPLPAERIEVTIDDTDYSMERRETVNFLGHVIDVNITDVDMSEKVRRLTLRANGEARYIKDGTPVYPNIDSHLQLKIDADGSKDHVGGEPKPGGQADFMMIEETTYGRVPNTGPPVHLINCRSEIVIGKREPEWPMRGSVLWTEFYPGEFDWLNFDLETREEGADIEWESRLFCWPTLSNLRLGWNEFDGSWPERVGTAEAVFSVRPYAEAAGKALAESLSMRSTDNLDITGHSAGGDIKISPEFARAMADALKKNMDKTFESIMARTAHPTALRVGDTLDVNGKSFTITESNAPVDPLGWHVELRSVKSSQRLVMVDDASGRETVLS